MPKISIVTVNFNNADGLQQTISSVAAQSLLNFEYVVVDGGSSDASVALIETKKDVISHWISKADTGVYQAMNRGIRMATGDYVLFLNSGDTFCSETVLQDVSEKITNDKDIYYGNLIFKVEQKAYEQEYPEEFDFGYFLDRSLPHPGSFIKKELFDRIFYYSEEYRIVSDWEFFLCAILKEKVTYQHLNMLISNFDLRGMSNDPKNKGKIEQERLSVFRKHFPDMYEETLAQMEERKMLHRKEIQQLSKAGSPRTAKKLARKFLKKLYKIIQNKPKGVS